MDAERAIDVLNFQPINGTKSRLGLEEQTAPTDRADMHGQSQERT